MLTLGRQTSAPSPPHTGQNTVVASKKLLRHGEKTLLQDIRKGAIWPWQGKRRHNLDLQIDFINRQLELDA
jgi:hypothetical protein